MQPAQKFSSFKNREAPPLTTGNLDLGLDVAAGAKGYWIRAKSYSVLTPRKTTRFQNSSHDYHTVTMGTQK